MSAGISVYMIGMKFAAEGPEGIVIAMLMCAFVGKSVAVDIRAHSLNQKSIMTGRRMDDRLLVGYEFHQIYGG